MNLAEKGIINGTGNNKFSPWENVTRGQIAKMFTEAQGLEIPENVKEVLSVYDDVDENSDYAKYIAAVTEAGVFEGNNGKFNEYDDISREQMATGLVNAFHLDDIEYDEEAPINLDHASENHKPAIQTLANLGITENLSNFRAYDKITRAAFATLLDRTMDVAGYDDVEAAIENVSAINAKTLKVEFNKSVSLEEDNFKVNKGAVKFNISDIKIAEDQKSAEIELTSKLTKGEYTVTLERKGKEDLTGSVTVQDEKVNAVNILSDVAPVTTTDNNGNLKETTAAFNVENQYGEDVTKAYLSGIEATASGAATDVQLNADGTMTFSLRDGAKVGDKINLTLIDRATGKSATKQIEISEEAVAAQAEFGDLYNKDGKELSQDSDVKKDTFYLPITVEDQYGEKVTDADKANKELIITNANAGIVKFADNDKIKKVNINNKDVLALEVSEVNLAGSANVLAISKNTGKSAQTSVNVKEGVKINSVSLDVPSEVVTAGKEVDFPLTVVDTEGNEITSKGDLDKIKDSLVPNDDDYDIIEKKDKGLFVRVPGNKVEENKPITVVVTSGSGKVATQTVTPKEAAKASVITGLSKDISTEVRPGKNVEINNTDLIVEDQYGQEITDKEVLKELKFVANAPKNSKTFDVEDAQNKKSTVIAAKNPEKDSEKLTFKLLDSDNKEMESSAFTQNFTVVKDSAFESYSVGDVNTVYVDKNKKTPENHQQELVVKAKTKAGNTVELDEGTDYSVKSSDVKLGNTDRNKIVGFDGEFEKDETSATGTVTITINGTGDEITKEVKFSDETPKVEEAAVLKDAEEDTLEAYKDGKDVEFTSTKFDGQGFDISSFLEDRQVAATDQYGVTVPNESGADKNGIKFKFDDTDGVEAVNVTPTLTLSNKEGDMKFANNGTKDANVEAAKKGAIFDATLNLNGVKTSPIKVTVQEDFGVSNATVNFDNNNKTVSIGSFGHISELDSLEVTLHDGDDKEVAKATLNELGHFLHGSKKDTVDSKFTKQITEGNADYYNSTLVGERFTHEDLLVDKGEGNNSTTKFETGDTVFSPADGDATSISNKFLARDTASNGMKADVKSAWDFSAVSEDDLKSVTYAVVTYTKDGFTYTVSTKDAE